MPKALAAIDDSSQAPVERTEPGAPLPRAFYDRPVLKVAPDLIGCVVSHDGVSGVIVETEAYHDSEPACHAYVGLTPRTRVIFGAPGHAYVYRSYGIHSLLNAVCEREGVGAAVLIRALHPLAGIEQMRARRGLNGGRAGVGRRRRAGGEGRGGASVERRGGAGLGMRAAPSDTELCSGPGKLTQALGVTLEHNGVDLCGGGPVTIHARPPQWIEPQMVTGVRVGITKAADLPWRFCLAGSRHVSRPWPR